MRLLSPESDSACLIYIPQEHHPYHATSPLSQCRIAERLADAVKCADEMNGFTVQRQHRNNTKRV